MYVDDTEQLLEEYNNIFDSKEKKAAAFDKIARNYYLRNFGSLNKSDMDVLMFSLLLEEILDKSENDINTYSDYVLAKQLGITQSRVSNLKQKKQLQYPYAKFKWEESFKRCCANARLDGGKIKINLRDINLYYELKNQIELMGGYVEASLTRNLLVITPAEFFDLTSQMISKSAKKKLEVEINTRYAGDKEFQERLEKEPFAKAFKKRFKDNMPEVLAEVLKAFVPGTSVWIDALNGAIKAVIK